VQTATSAFGDAWSKLRKKPDAESWAPELRRLSHRKIQTDATPAEGPRLRGRGPDM